MPVILLLVFIGVPIAEISVFIEAGERFGLWPTIGVVVLTAVLGTALLRHQGLQTLARVQNSLNSGEIPVGELFAGICLLAAGLLLLTPGFLTDSVGFALFVPGIRNILAGGILQALSRRGAFQMEGGFSTGPTRDGNRSTTIIDGDLTEVQEKPDHPSSIPITNREDGRDT